jgi:hypothetical protein
MVLLDLRQLWQITHPSHPSQIAFYTLKEKRLLGMPSDLLIVLLTQMKIPIILIMCIFPIHK